MNIRGNHITAHTSAFTVEFVRDESQLVHVSSGQRQDNGFVNVVKKHDKRGRLEK